MQPASPHDPKTIPVTGASVTGIATKRTRNKRGKNT